MVWFSTPTITLKSDQNGIEIIFYYFLEFRNELLKSDQNGIEILSISTVEPLVRTS